MNNIINIVILIVFGLVGLAMFYAVINPEQAKRDVEELFSRRNKKRNR